MPAITISKSAPKSKGLQSRPPKPLDTTGLRPFGRIHRLLRLIALLQSGRDCDTPLLAKELAVSRRTVFRYLEVLRSIGMEFIHDTQAAGSAALKIESVLPNGVQEYCKDLMNKIKICPVPMARHEHSGDFFEMIQKAIYQKRKLAMVYRSFAEKERIRTTIDPYRLVFCQRAWYVVGYSSSHKSMRIFKLLRIYQLKTLSKLYVPDETFNLDEFFGYAWSMIPEGKIYRVVLRFSSKVAGNVAEVLWHKTQQIEWLKDGSMIFRVTVDGLNEISWWILGYGAEVAVVAPAVLQKRLVRTARQMVTLYERKPK